MKRSESFAIKLADQANEKQVTEYIRNNLIENNRSFSEIAEEEVIVVYATDEKDVIVGGVSATLWGACLEINYLWVSEDFRGKMLGSNLLSELENTAYSKGCRRIIVDTYSFQAPEFYIKSGYSERLKFEGYSNGEVSKIFLTKELNR